MLFVGFSEPGDSLARSPMPLQAVASPHRVPQQRGKLPGHSRSPCCLCPHSPSFLLPRGVPVSPDNPQVTACASAPRPLTTLFVTSPRLIQPPSVAWPPKRTERLDSGTDMASLACLLGLLTLLSCVTASLAHAPGSPLSDKEYQAFFLTLWPPWRAEVLCTIRQTYGCLSPGILKMDRLENHGVVPKGSICSDFPERMRFESFCQFAHYRCFQGQFYVKRIRCPNTSTHKNLFLAGQHEAVGSGVKDQSSPAREAPGQASVSPPGALLESTGLLPLPPTVPSPAAPAPLPNKLESPAQEEASWKQRLWSSISKLISWALSTENPLGSSPQRSPEAGAGSTPSTAQEAAQAAAPHGR
ncbi:uncharacterized protein LOC128852539 [Cuculus canorus]|uniref:uncharacterized protein LOC128852539 n=1 Tax=Cuculus canorus TaxID=55661 RepID=UPI0023AA5CE7|nr:uncharacterized protein LOC128852539 [Cuculus canorus]